MFDRDKWQEILATIQKHKLRTFLTCLGVFWGIFMLTFLMGAGKGLENGVNTQIGGHAFNSMYCWTESTSFPYRGFKAGRETDITMDDLAAIRSEFSEEVEYISGFMWMREGTVTRGRNSAVFDMRGDMPDVINIQPFGLMQGRWINVRDLDEKRKVVVLGRAAKEVLFEEDENPIGETVIIKDLEFMVVGVIKSNRKGEDAVDDEKAMYIPITVSQQIKGQPDIVYWFGAAMYPNVSTAVVETKIKNFLKERHQIHPDDPKGIGSDNVEEEFRSVQGLFTGYPSADLVRRNRQPVCRRNRSG